MISDEEIPHFDRINADNLDWHKVDWELCEKVVQKLQARIAKAAKAQRWRAVRRLQRLLVRARSAKLLAVLRVTENRGKKTPGIDGEIWKTPKQKTQAVVSLGKKSYRPSPLRRIYIPKKNGKRRPLGIPTLSDRAMQALYLLALVPVAEVLADPNSYGFRPQRSAADAIGQCFNVLARKSSARWIYEADIRGCFDNISHSWLEHNAPMNRTILRRWL